LSINNDIGVFLRNTSSSTIQNVTANSNYYGIYLSSSASNTLTSNTANSNSNYGIYLSSSASSTLTSNTANSNYYGIYLYSSGSSTLTSNTANSNSNYGIYISSSDSNTLTSNIFQNNTYDLIDYSVNTYSSNQFLHNASSTMLTFTEVTSPKNVNNTINFDFSMFNTDGSACSSCSYTITTSPDESETLVSNKTGNNVTGSFTATKSGFYSIYFTITDANANITKRKISFLVGNTNSQTTRYYLRRAIPTHNQPIGNGDDSQSLLLTAPTNTEEWFCGSWIQNSPDELPIYPLANLSGIDIYSWYKQSMDSGAYIGIQRYLNYAAAIDASSTVPVAASYTWINKNFTGLNWPINYSYNWYWLALKLYGGFPHWQTTVAQPSYADFTYSYTTTPAVKSISNDDIIVLSATADPSDTDVASIVLENSLTSATSTEMVLTDFQRPFLNATSTIDSTATTTITTPAISAGATSTLDSVAMDITPSSGSVDITISTWNTSGDYSKTWTETGSAPAITTLHTIGSLKSTTYYTISVDGYPDQTLQSNSSGQITYTYSGGYSIHTFTVSEEDTSPTISLTSPSNNSDSVSSTDSLQWSGSDTGAGIASYQLYIDGATVGNTTTSTSASIPTLSCNDSHSWYVRALDNNGNATNSSTYSFTIPCGSISTTITHGSPPSSQSSIPITSTDSTSSPQANSGQAGLSSTQISSIIAVLASFGVDSATIANIQAILSGNPPASQSSTTSFTRDLKLGMIGADVKALQQFLNTHGYILTSTGLGSPGHETTLFGSLTKSALIRFQKAHNITPSVGYFGVKTKGEVSAL